MADSTDHNCSHTTNHSKWPHQRPDEENPFVSFRRYADEQLSSLLQSFIGLPSALSPPSSRGWLYFQGDDPATKFRHQSRHTLETGDSNQESNGPQYSSEKCTCGRDDARQYSHTGGHIPERDTRRFHEPFDRWWLESRPHFEHHFPSSIFDSPLENLWPFDPAHFFSHIPRSSSPFDFLTSSASLPGWPVPYLLFSPYSPLHLERQQNIRQKPHERPLSSLFSAFVPSHDAPESDTPRWREAFEDLLRVENGQDMLNSDLGAVVRKEHPKAWISGMISRGSLGPHWTHVQQGPNDYFNYRYSQSAHGNGAGKPGTSQKGTANEYDDREHYMQEDKWLTELDLYEKFLNQVNEPSNQDNVPFVSPLMGMIMEDRLRRRKRLLQHQQRQWEQTAENKALNNQEDGSEGGTNNTALMQTSHPSPPPPYVTSTITTTERRTLPDGSMQTTITQKKRFSDGKEECNETVQVEASNQALTGSKGTQAQSLEQTKQTNDHGSPAQKKRGWFWKD
ncbi:hypothetical protein AJ78_02551 [Emergomyces pasteurianus Ep9510]|uniref:Uncharacterized protein n=1 Tax=Emergomyces pasteurianus Ep9510 TaxID=1447872 RepID=A0A1J9PMN0_9EURO|nr:hypothetical protein AJ78_02551 [Emergomyces pasteurianus Ep9510]